MSDKPLNALKAALEFEEKGKKFYIKTAADAADALSQKLFTVLAQDEERHAARIQEIFASLDKSLPWPSQATPADQGKLEAEIRSFFEANRNTLKKDATRLEGYEFAIKMERTGLELYGKFARETDSLPERSFFEALILEERNHLDAVTNVHFFLADPGDWYEQDESRRWNWMNV